MDWDPVKLWTISLPLLKNEHIEIFNNIVKNETIYDLLVCTVELTIKLTYITITNYSMKGNLVVTLFRMLL